MFSLIFSCGHFLQFFDRVTPCVAPHLNEWQCTWVINELKKYEIATHVFIELKKSKKESQKEGHMINLYLLVRIHHTSSSLPI